MKITRRGCLGAGLVWPLAHAAPANPQPAVSADPSDSSIDPWIEIHPENLRHNVREISRRASGCPILAVIKNNGYGLGVANVARIFDPMPEIAGCAVVKLDEAVRVHQGGFKKPILLMGPFDEKNLEEIVAKNIVPMIYTPVGAALDRVARNLQRPVPVHICLDTGLGREGVPYREAPDLIRDLAAHKGVRIEGIMMTFTEDPEFDPEQLRRFQQLANSLESGGVRLGKKHAASSFAMFQRPEAFLDMVRPGMALFGIYSEAQFRKQGILDLRPGVALKTRVLYVKKLPKGEAAGYERAFKPTRDTWIATLPIGHADGLPRNIVDGARVRIGDGMFRAVAVSASHLIVEIGDERRANAGDVATIFDWTEGSRPEDVGEACKASVYDLTMHLNPLLRRKFIGAA